jgi:hypothetical protein
MGIGWSGECEITDVGKACQICQLGVMNHVFTVSRGENIQAPNSSPSLWPT